MAFLPHRSLLREIRLRLNLVADDRFDTAGTARERSGRARFAAGDLPARGHSWVGHDAEVWREVAAFIATLQETP